ncbi:programmed cell death protein 2 [Thraustotheca clavata]|uniref:Programmed cell death protein 2 n=1 Tax=Thraustotheca clavata TaxID=74557 RepID=A0A1V9YWT3_9STRA|nr:programmed cell death protein 2 [Thraustotheca clavata]
MVATRDVQEEQNDHFNEDVNAAPFLEDEDDDDDEGLDAEAEIELGFVSNVEEEHLSGAYVNWDGGKVGGQPVWLDPSVNIEVPCECGVNMSFLLQIYCPLDTPPQAFHRSLYVFCCRTRGCSKIGHARVFRVQLPQKNAFYSEKEDDPTRKQPEYLKAAKQCAVCGLKGIFACSACNIAQYCSKVHQKDHWKHGHKQDCPASAQQKKLIESNAEAIRLNGTPFVFPEYSIHIEHEPDRSIAQNESEARMMQAFEQASLNRTEGNDVFTDDSEIDLSQKDIAKMLGTQAQDKTYVGFLTRVALAKDQVLRYSRWDDEEPVLWVHSQDKPTDIPCCSICHGPRRFEFQIMPQLLYHLKLSTELTTLKDQEVDWGTLVVYTCPQSCSAKDKDVDIVEEFVWRQSPHDQEV